MMICHLNENGTSYLDTMIQCNIKPEWLDNELIKEAMKDIEHVYKIEGLAFYSTDWGVKSPQSLSNGMKALLLLANIPEDYFENEVERHISNGSIGDNVVDFLRRLSLECDFHIAYDIWLPLEYDMPIKAMDYETGVTFSDTRELHEFYGGKCCM